MHITLINRLQQGKERKKIHKFDRNWTRYVYSRTYLQPSAKHNNL